MVGGALVPLNKLTCGSVDQAFLRSPIILGTRGHRLGPTFVLTCERALYEKLPKWVWYSCLELPFAPSFCIKFGLHRGGKEEPYHDLSGTLTEDNLARRAVVSTQNRVKLFQELTIGGILQATSFSKVPSRSAFVDVPQVVQPLEDLALVWQSVNPRFMRAHRSDYSLI